MALEKIRTYVDFDDGETCLIDTIEHEGDLWLVINWIDTPFPAMKKPGRIIRLPKDRLQDLGVLVDTGPRIHKLNGLMPKAVLDGTSLPNPPLDVVEAPDLLIRR